MFDESHKWFVFLPGTSRSSHGMPHTWIFSFINYIWPCQQVHHHHHHQPHSLCRVRVKARVVPDLTSSFRTPLSPYRSTPSDPQSNFSPVAPAIPVLQPPFSTIHLPSPSPHTIFPRNLRFLFFTVSTSLPGSNPHFIITSWFTYSLHQQPPGSCPITFNEEHIKCTGDVSVL